MIIEFAGLPRSEKSTLAKKFENDFSIQEEFFDEVPYDREEHEKYNLWYAGKVRSFLKDVLNSTKNVIIQRGALDRIAFAKSLFDYGLISRECFEAHLRILGELVESTDKIILCDCSVEESIRRDHSPNKLTGDKKFLSILRKNYLELGKRYNARIIDTNKPTSLEFP